MIAKLEQALANLQLIIDEGEYLLIKLPARAITAAAGVVAEIGEPFCALVVDPLEVTLIIPSEALDFVQRLPGHTVAPESYRLITLDIELDLSLVGFLASISQSLAQAQVPIIALSAFSRDHLLVCADQLEAARAALDRLKMQYQ